jgi:hypothetical protein
MSDEKLSKEIGLLSKEIAKLFENKEVSVVLGSLIVIMGGLFNGQYDIVAEYLGVERSGKDKEEIAKESLGIFFGITKDLVYSKLHATDLNGGSRA